MLAVTTVQLEGNAARESASNRDTPADCVKGLVVDYFPDETDPRYHHLYLFSDGMLLAAALDQTWPDNLVATNLINAYVSISGLTLKRQTKGLRRHRSPFLLNVSEIKILKRPPAPPNIARPLVPTEGFTKEEIQRLGVRTVCGRVLATWGGTSLFVETEHCGKIRVLLAHAAVPPPIGTTIQVTGIADTDTIDLILKCATWTEASPLALPEAEAKTVSSDDLQLRGAYLRFSKSLVRITGKVGYKSSDPSENSTLLVECGRSTIHVDPGETPQAFNNVKIGSTVEITGIGHCILDPDTTGLPFARFKELMVIIRSADDVKIIKSAPWWTPRRLFGIIALLTTVLVGILIWNKVLRRLIVRRSRQLAAEALAHAESDLKFDERTRLAVELHDSLSQTLTGAAMEIRAATMLKGDAPQDMIKHLDTAALTLQSCRDELRNCLWDLRSQALDVSNMSAAIMRTLEPYVNESRLSVRFNVPRNRFSDNTAHVILRIVRELVLNAIRHGRANAVKVAGSLDGGWLRFSVTDDGIGFDPDNRPGVLQGHFGLQGIKERLRSYNGRLSIRSAPGAGTKVNIEIMMPAEANKI